MFVTSIFLHANLSHLFFNMFALFFVGIYLERMVGRRTFFTIFLTSGIIGNLGYLVTASNPQVPAIGASGAVYGVMGALAVIAPFLLVYVYGFLPLPMILVAVLYGLADFAGLFVPSGIANGAHLGGMFVGASYGVYLRRIARRITV
ncbi:MAG: rhomboid family intramembrane serine protease [Thaumarchaeota archaeon]|nr:rhomboid family intramembrane serine protease [Nitrososphaerota archaeon]